MYAVGAVLTLVGAGLLLSLARPAGPARVYVFRMVGIMALAAGIVLVFSAWSMHGWSTQIVNGQTVNGASPPSTPAPG